MARPLNSSRQTRALFDAFLREPGGWRYGYDLGKQTGLKSGTLYPILKRLERQGLMETRWDQPSIAGRPPRHLYRMTLNGISAAILQIAERSRLRWEQLFPGAAATRS